MEITLTNTEWTSLSSLNLEEGKTYGFAISSPINPGLVWRYSVSNNPDSATDGIPVIGNEYRKHKYYEDDMIKVDFATTTQPVKITIQECK